METILLVDDDAAVCNCLNEILTRFGYQVVTRSNAQSALEYLRAAGTVSLVIADYRMPGMSGLEMVRHVREMNAKMPVVMLTGHEDFESYLCAQSLGNMQYVMKPVGAWELQKIIKNALTTGTC